MDVPLIALVTDFGLHGPYVGQMEAAVHALAPTARVVNLFADAPVHDPRASAYLLAAYGPSLPAGAIVLCVVDPRVGTFRDRPMVARIDGRWYVGPDNGLFNTLIKHAGSAECFEITWRPERVSASFHGRDLYAPVAGMLAGGQPPPGPAVALPDLSSWPDDLSRIIYIDHFGNAMTGLRAAVVPHDAALHVRGHAIRRARTFAAVAVGEAMWYENANGLVEIAVNRGRAEQVLDLRVGESVAWT